MSDYEEEEFEDDFEDDEADDDGFDTPPPKQPAKKPETPGQSKTDTQIKNNAQNSKQEQEGDDEEIDDDEDVEEEEEEYEEFIEEDVEDEPLTAEKKSKAPTPTIRSERTPPQRTKTPVDSLPHNHSLPPIAAPLEKPAESSLPPVTKPDSRSKGDPPRELRKEKVSPQMPGQGTNQKPTKPHPAPHIPPLPKPTRMEPHNPVRPALRAENVEPRIRTNIYAAANLSGGGKHPSDLEPMARDNVKMKANANGHHRAKPMGYYPRSIVDRKKDKIVIKKPKPTDFHEFTDLENELVEKGRVIDQLKIDVRTLEAINRRYEKDFIALSEQYENMPKQIGGLQYEIRALKERLRSSQERVSLSERTIQNQEDYIVKLKAHCKKLEGILKSKNLSENIVEDDEKLRKLIDEKDNTIKDLRNQVKLLQDARESDYKKHKSSLKTAQAETAQVRREMEKIIQQFTERDNEMKVNNVKLEKEMNRKKKELLEAQKQLQVQAQSQLPMQNAQIIPPNVPHGVTPPTQTEHGNDESVSVQHAQTKAHTTNAQLAKNAHMNHPKQEVHSEPREPSEPTQEMAQPQAPVAKNAPKNTGNPKTENKIEKVSKPQKSDTQLKVAKPVKKAVVNEEKEEDKLTAGMSSHPSITSMPISSLAKNSNGAIGAPMPKSQPQSQSQSQPQPKPTEPLFAQNTSPQKLSTGKEKPAEPVAPQPHADSLSKRPVQDADIDDSVVYESDEDRGLLTPTSKHEEPSAINLQPPKSQSPLPANDESDFESLSEPEEALPMPEEKETPRKMPFTQPADTEDEDEVEDEKENTLDTEEIESTLPTEPPQPPSQSEAIKTTSKKEAMTYHNKALFDDDDIEQEELLDDVGYNGGGEADGDGNDNDDNVAFRAENIVKSGMVPDDDDLPDIVNQQNRVMDEARWTKKSDTEEPIPAYGAVTSAGGAHSSSRQRSPPPFQARKPSGSQYSPLSQISLGQTGGGEKTNDLPMFKDEVEAAAPPPSIPQDSILKPAFGRPKKKYT